MSRVWEADNSIRLLPQFESLLWRIDRVLYPPKLPYNVGRSNVSHLMYHSDQADA
jgi:hypothetical protein